MRIRITCNENAGQVLIGIDPIGHLERGAAGSKPPPKKISDMIRRIESTFREPVTPDKIEKRKRALEDLRIACTKPYQAVLDLFAQAIADGDELVAEEAGKGLFSQIDLGLSCATFTSVERVTETGASLRIGRHPSFPNERLFDNVSLAKMSLERLPDLVNEGIVSILQRQITPHDADRMLQQQAKTYDVYREATRGELQVALEAMIGNRWCPELPARVRRIRDALRCASLAVVCPKCGKAAMLDFTDDQPFHPDDPGSIRFRHGQGTHGFKADQPFPELLVVDAPTPAPRKPRKRSTRS